MTSIEKLEKMLINNSINQKLEFNKLLKIMRVIKEPYPFISSVNFDIMIDVLGDLGFSEEEKTEIVAYYYSKTLNFYNRDKRNEYIYNLSFKQILKNHLVIGPSYEEQCKAVNVIRMIVDEEGNILPAKMTIDEVKIIVFKNICSISREYVLKILKLSQKKHKECLKKDSIRECRIEELYKKLFPNDVHDHYFSEQEINDIKNRMLKLGYSAEEIEKIVDNIIATNGIIEKKTEPIKKTEVKVDYKALRMYNHQLRQFIDEGDKPYDYMTEEQIEEVVYLLNQLGYTEARKDTILNNIRKLNESIKQKEAATKYKQLQTEIFGVIDKREDKPFAALSFEIYEQALESQTKLEELNNKINIALNEIQNSITTLTKSSDEFKFYIEYIMENLSEIDQCFSNAKTWNLIKERK
ncbi:MAG: hypothetical protein IJA94_02985 [Bacilli bacterium]|nr:hypothetical protein [Bacilli bacterium]